MFPMNNQKGSGLSIEKQILPQEPPSSTRLAAPTRRLRIIRVVAKGLNVAHHLPLHGQRTFEGGTGRHAVVVVDRQYALRENTRACQRTPRVKSILCNRHGADKLLNTTHILFSGRR